MTDEEKKAIEIVKGITEDDLLNYWEGPEEPYNAIQTILNLFEKQSKEIELLKEKNKTLKNLQNDTNRLYTEMIERKNYFERELQKLEDKIKAKIEELDEQINKEEKETAGRCITIGKSEAILILLSLLEEKE